MYNAGDIGVVIPTYGREKVLLDTVGQMLDQQPRPGRIIIVDQTPNHDPATHRTLSAWTDEGHITWLKSKKPSQPAALNRGLLEADLPLALFLDDDIRVAPDFVARHAAAFRDDSIVAVAGRVVQPDSPSEAVVPPPRRWRFPDLDFPFHSTERGFIANGMSGNLCVRCDAALAVGGFDEQFEPPVSYRFDLEFCRRLIKHGGRILFEPTAAIQHLRAGAGGTRSLGSHLTSASPMHGVGDYYFALLEGFTPTALLHILRRPFREIRTRFHLRHPWWIPVKFTGELRALARALRLCRQGPKRIQNDQLKTPSSLTSQAQTHE